MKLLLMMTMVILAGVMRIIHRDIPCYNCLLHRKSYLRKLARTRASGSPSTSLGISLRETMQGPFLFWLLCHRVPVAMEVLQRPFLIVSFQRLKLREASRQAAAATRSPSARACCGSRSGDALTAIHPASLLSFSPSSINLALDIFYLRFVSFIAFLPSAMNFYNPHPLLL